MIDDLVVRPGERVNLAKRAPDSRLGLTSKSEGAARLAGLHTQLRDLQNRLWAESRRSVLLVLQALDAGGKDGTIRSVFTGVNPQGVRVVSFKQPSETELGHDYLWHVHHEVPERGAIGIFNRSHYEDVLVVRVHGIVSKHEWRQRYRHIREFERMLADEGTTIVKVFLHISPDEQRERLQSRLDTPDKNWKFRAGDLEDRARWDDFMAAYTDAIAETSTAWAPWYVVPANRKWVRNVAVSTVLVHTLKAMDPQYPPPEKGIESIKIV